MGDEPPQLGGTCQPAHKVGGREEGGSRNHPPQQYTEPNTQEKGDMLAVTLKTGAVQNAHEMLPTTPTPEPEWYKFVPDHNLAGSVVGTTNFYLLAS